MVLALKTAFLLFAIFLSGSECGVCSDDISQFENLLCIMIEKAIIKVHKANYVTLDIQVRISAIYRVTQIKL